MINLEKRYLDILKSIISHYIPDCEVRIFGSRTRSNCKKYSDIDIVALNNTPLEEKAKRDMMESFDESDIPYRVDFVEWTDLDEQFRAGILKDSILIA